MIEFFAFLVEKLFDGFLLSGNISDIHDISYIFPPILPQNIVVGRSVLERERGASVWHAGKQLLEGGRSAIPEVEEGKGTIETIAISFDSSVLGKVVFILLQPLGDLLNGEILVEFLQR